MNLKIAAALLDASTAALTPSWRTQRTGPALHGRVGHTARPRRLQLSRAEAWATPELPGPVLVLVLRNKNVFGFRLLCALLWFSSRAGPLLKASAASFLPRIVWKLKVHHLFVTLCTCVGVQTLVDFAAVVRCTRNCSKATPVGSFRCAAELLLVTGKNRGKGQFHGVEPHAHDMQNRASCSTCHAKKTSCSTCHAKKNTCCKKHAKNKLFSPGSLAICAICAIY